MRANDLGILNQQLRERIVNLPVSARLFRADPAHTNEAAQQLKVSMTTLFGTAANPTPLCAGDNVAVYSSARDKLPEHKANQEIIYTLGKALGKRELNVVTGAGPGGMEAANKGAREVGAYSAGVGLTGLPGEQKMNEYMDAFLAIREFFIRKLAFNLASDAFVACVGGFGTGDEAMEAWNLCSKFNITSVPIVLLGKEYYGPLYEVFERMERNDVITARELSMLTLCSEPEEAADFVKLKIAANRGLRTKDRSYDKDLVLKLTRDMNRVGMQLCEDAPYVSVIGGNNNTDGGSEFQLNAANRLGAFLAREGMPTLTTGLNRLTDQFNRGVLSQNGISSGFVHYPSEEGRDASLTNPIKHKYRFTEAVTSTKYGSGPKIYFEGGPAMFDSLFETLTLQQTTKVSDTSVICVGREFFGPIKQYIEVKMRDQFKTICPHHVDLFRIVDTAEEAFELVRSEREKCIERRLEKLSANLAYL